MMRLCHLPNTYQIVHALWKSLCVPVDGLTFRYFSQNTIHIQLYTLRYVGRHGPLFVETNADRSAYVYITNGALQR